MIICGAINVIGNAIYVAFMGGEFRYSYTDIDGQPITLSISANTMLAMAILKILAGALAVWQGRAMNKVFKPIVKEYRDAERGATQGILMNKRKSKKMKVLMKKILKITGLGMVLLIVSIKLTKNLVWDQITQFVD